MISDWQKIFIGEIIKQKIDERHISYAEFARRMRWHRTTVYQLFKKKSIDVDELLAISEILDYDFLHEVYCNDHNLDGKPYLAIPISSHGLQLSDLPEELKSMLRRETKRLS